MFKFPKIRKIILELQQTNGFAENESADYMR